LAAALSGIAAWAALSTQLPAVLLPSPLDVAAALLEHAVKLGQASLHTGLAAVLGLLLAAALGIIIGVLFLRSRALELALYPYALFVQTLPVVAVAPLLVVWLGYGTPVAVVAAGIVAFFPMLTAVHVGLRSVTPEQVELLAIHGASWSQELVRLRIPGALPQFFAGLRSAGGLAVIGAIVGEFVGSNGLPPSIGYLVLRSARAADTALGFAAIGCAALLAIGSFVLVRLAEARFIGHWHGRARR
jgi:NitT/TauT family transport system permease protein